MSSEADVGVGNRILLIAFRWAPLLPSGLLYWIADAAAVLLAAIRPRPKAVQRLQGNLVRVSSSTNQALVRKALRSYGRYYASVLTLPRLDAGQLDECVNLAAPDCFHSDIAAGSVVLALGHQSDWDLAATWTARNLAPIVTVVERLQPPELTNEYLRRRQHAGIAVLYAEPGQQVYATLRKRVQGRRVIVGLLADRSITGSGVQSSLAGCPVMIAPGPAALALREGLPLYTADLADYLLPPSCAARVGRKWGVKIQVQGPFAVANEDEGAVVKLSHQWHEAWEALMMKHPQDWHMTQPVFLADLKQPNRIEQ